MAVSANTLFHFTSIKGLTGILASGGFYCQYSPEHFENILPSKSHYRFTYLPMTSFCDLTIMQLSNDSLHRKSFGDFGIGLTKAWGVRNGVSPVMYVHKESQQTKRLNRLIKAIKQFRKNTVDEETLDELAEETLDAIEQIDNIEQEMIDSFKYIKPYTGYWQKGKRKRKKIIFYDEREWRYSPLMKEYAVLSGVFKDNKKEVKEINEKLKKKIIKFEVNDVKFIVIKKKKDLSAISDVIQNMTISEEQKDQLKTKVISFEEIKEDFG